MNCGIDSKKQMQVALLQQLLKNSGISMSDFQIDPWILNGKPLQNLWKQNARPGNM